MDDEWSDRQLEMLNAICEVADELEKTPTQKDMVDRGYTTWYRQFESWNTALEAAGFTVNRRRKKTSKEELITELKSLANRLGRTPIGDDMREHGQFSVNIYENRFGSWNNALDAADFNPTLRRDIPEDELIDEIQSLADSLGRTPTLKDLNEHGRFSPDPYRNRFGSWNAALLKASVSTNHRVNISKNELLTALQSLADQLGRTPVSDDMDEYGQFSTNVYERRFGSWNDALEKAGLTPVRIRNISDDELLSNLQSLADKLERTPTIYDMRDYGRFSEPTYSDRFGSWNDALDAAGFNPTLRRDIPEGELIGEIQSLADQLGRAPTRIDMIKEGKFSVEPYLHRFGSWNDSLRESGFLPNIRFDVSEEKLISELQSLADELERQPVISDLQENDLASAPTYANQFGSWIDAREAAGFDRHISGKDHPNWKGGYEGYYGPNWNSQRNKTLVRDDYTCRVCGITRTEHLAKYGRSLDVHHIVSMLTFYRQADCVAAEVDFESANDLSNLVALCIPCHNKWEGSPVVPNCNK